MKHAPILVLLGIALIGCSDSTGTDAPPSATTNPPGDDTDTLWGETGTDENLATGTATGVETGSTGDTHTAVDTGTGADTGSTGDTNTGVATGTGGDTGSSGDTSIGLATDTDTRADTGSSADTTAPPTEADSDSDTAADTGTQAPSPCAAGIPNGAGTVCCPASCGSCGGAGCSGLPGGADNCCAGTIANTQRYCDQSPPPCIVGSPPEDTGGDTGSAPGEVLWYADPNLPLTTVFYRFDTHGNANPTGNECVDNPDTPPVASTPTDPVVGKHWRIWKPPARKRAEFARTNGFVPQEGDDLYVGWRWRITSPDPITSGMAVFQWKSEAGDATWPNTQNYPFNMSYDGTELKVTAFGPGYPDWTEGSSITNRATTIWKRAVSLGEWVTIVFHVKVSRDPSIGFIEFWFNGEQQTLMNADYKEYQVTLANNNTRAYHKTMDSTQVYMKWGAYGQGACDLDVTVDFDEMRVATTYALVAQPLQQ